MTDRTVEVQCPVEIADTGDSHGTSSVQCDGTLQVEMTWEPPDPHYGMDADGNRGTYVSGYWAMSDHPLECEVCSTTFNAAQLQQIEDAAAAESFDSPDDYDGPDCDDMDDDE